MIVVGPGTTLEDYRSGNKKPDLFERRIKDWILAFAKHLAYEHKDTGIAVLLLTSSVLEPLGGVLPMKKGRNSKDKFCDGFMRVFPEVPGSESVLQVSKRLCDLLRNGLFHEAYIKPGLILTSQDRPILESDGDIYLDPVRFLDAVDSAFSEVCNDIRYAEADAPIRQSFDYYWNQKEAEQAKTPEAVITPETEYLAESGTGTCGTSTLAPAGWEGSGLFVKDRTGDER